MYGKSKGILAFANNSPTVNYEKIANQTLLMAGRVLDLPVHLVIGQQQDNWRNTRYDVDTGQNVKWNNFNRYQVWDASPFDQTIVIDVDYLVTTQRLLGLFDTQQDLIFCRHNNMLFRPTLDVTKISPIWATVFYFRKTDRSRLFFDLVGRIQRNWEYYCLLFGLVSSRYRNDYAFAMAAEIMKVDSTMPFGITTADSAVSDISINEDWMVVRTEQQAHILPRQDLHVMSKAWLQSSKLEEFIKCVV